ncbi:MAG: hypothetical protein BGO49_08270 [Planctomycetales bacterium 71-10]|nr:MAG: hypothetical protein BGO49_08270 [Planctomycetales bacterium 71-10]
MDEHVRALRARLGGRPIVEKIHWVRGPLLGAEGRAALGMCMGSRAGEVGPEGDPLAYLDRHEVAHCVLNGVVPFLEIDPPALLVEGWAEANAGRPREEVRRQVRNLRRNGDERSLRALVGPAWYHAHAGAVYPQGAILVDHILDAYGPDKFLELYRTCRPGTFEADCRRILGVGLDELDAACRAEVDRAAPPASSLGDALASLKLGPDVDAGRWKAFAREVAAGIGRSDRVYEHARAVVAMTWTAKPAAAGPSGGGVRWTWIRSGPRRAVVFEESETKEGDLWSAPPGFRKVSAWSAAPERSFRATRKPPGDAWRLQGDPDGTPQAAYLRMCVEVDGRRPSALTPSPGVFGPFELTRLRATSLEPSEGPGGRRVRVRFESEGPVAAYELRSSECVFDADRGLAILSEVQAHEGGGESRTDFRYDDGDPPLLVSKRLTGSGPGQNDRVVDWTVVERRFGPIPDEAFAPEALLDGPVVVDEAVEVPWTDPPTLADWYPAPLAAGAAAVVAGLALGLAGGFRRP